MSDVLQHTTAPCACGCGEAVPISGLGDAWYDFIGTGAERKKVFFVDKAHLKTWKQEQPQSPP